VSAHFRRDHLQALVVTIELLGALPLTLVAWAAGRLLFRALGDSSHRLWIAVGLPWLVYACVGALEYIRSLAYETGGALLVNAVGWMFYRSRRRPAAAAPICGADL
jgi:predicted signal transduction protein with EAL and GGDEF domain